MTTTKKLMTAAIAAVALAVVFAILYLTPIGRQINSRRAGTVEAAVQRAMANHSQESLRTVEKVLRGLAEELDNDPGA